MSTSSSAYRIIDEPVATGASNWAVNPTFPLLAAMICGSWLAWPWFLFNHYAISGTKPKKAFLLIVSNIVVLFAILLLGGTALKAGIINEAAKPYVQIALLGVKLTFAYLMYTAQLGAFELLEHFGRKPRPGLFVVIGGLFARSAVLGALPGWLAIVLR